MPIPDMPLDSLPFYWLAKRLKQFLRPDQPTVTATFIKTRERMQIYRITLSDTLLQDGVTRRELTVVVNSDAPYTKDVISGDEIGFPADSTVILTLRDFDAAGNGSEPSDPFTLQTNATDVTPPGKPSILGVFYLRDE